jgi:hypothetical protein
MTLDRMQITTPRAAHASSKRPGLDDELWAATKNAASRFSRRSRFSAGATSAGDRHGHRGLLLSLADVIDPSEPPARTRPFTAITHWLTTTLLDALPPLVRPDEWTTAKTAYESRLLQALAGRPSDPDAPTLKWEGLDYRVDWFAAEHARLKRIREQIESPGLDAALAANDADKISEALLTSIYTPALGDPEGPALLGGDIAQRHNFGLVGPAGMRRDFVAWAVPKEQVGDGTPWRVEGSILGLDIALARLGLRRIADNEMPVAPTINLNDQLNFARTVMTINPRSLRDQDRDVIVAAIARGRERVKAAGAGLPAVRALAEEIQLPASIRQTLPWTVTRTPDAVPALFGLRDLMWLGKPELSQETLDHWGVFAEVLDNRLRTAMPRPAPWEDFGGRADGGCRDAGAGPGASPGGKTARLKLPAQLVPGLLMYAAQDYWHDVESRFPDDWPAMTRQALALSPTRVEDYVAALAGGGPLRPR